MIERMSVGVLAGTTVAYAVVAATRSVIRTIVINNRDSVDVTVVATVFGTEMWKCTMSPNDILNCDDVYVLDAGASLQFTMSAAITTTAPTFTVTYAEVE
jgi:Na+-transporting NADH:ubiquinone oxidoreductase subunit NqrF